MSSNKINNNLYLRNKRAVDTALGSINTLAQLRGYKFIVGSVLQLSQGLANHTSINNAITAAVAGDSIYILSGTYNENVLVSKQGLLITGQAYSTFINGTLNFNSASDFSLLRDLRINGNVTFQVGTQGCSLDGYQTTASTVSDLGTDNLYTLIGT